MAYDDTEIIVPLAQYKYNATETTLGHCVYSISLYLSTGFDDAEKSNLPVIAAVGISVVFIIMIATFCVYDRFVRRRNEKVVNAAARSNAILSSLFPSQVRD